MTNPEREACYGRTFPDPLHFVDNQASFGKVLGLKLESIPWACRTGRSIQVDEQAWEHCLACPQFAHCYQLCMAKLALAAAIASQ